MKRNRQPIYLLEETQLLQPLLSVKVTPSP